MGSVLVNRTGRRPGAALLRFAVAGLSFLLLVAVAGLVVVEVRPGWVSALRNARPAPPPPNPLAALGGSPTAGAGGRPGSTGSTAASAPTSPAAGATGPGAPVLVALDPSSVGPGEVLRLRGDHLYSSTGRIEVTVAGHQAAVRCPNEHSCLVTVPPLGGRPRPALLQLRTSGGRSNTVSFGYR